MKVVEILLLTVFAGLLILASSTLPPRGEVEAPLNRDRSPAGSPGAANAYIRNAYHDAHTPNIVTVILADYRSFDTLGETLVVFTAGIACFLILRRPRQ